MLLVVAKGRERVISEIMTEAIRDDLLGKVDKLRALFNSHETSPLGRLSAGGSLLQLEQSLTLHVGSNRLTKGEAGAVKARISAVFQPLDTTPKVRYIPDTVSE